MDDKSVQIMFGAAKLFMTYGMKSVSMDDIARELKVSKKTIYQYFEDKSTLISKIIEFKNEEEIKQVLELEKQSENAIDEIILITKLKSEHIKEMHPSIKYDLAKYYPEAWNLFQIHKKEMIFNHIKKNLKRGVEEELYRDSINATIIAKLFSEKIDMVIDNDIFPVSEFKFEEVYYEMMRYHLRGIASKKGVEYLQERINKEKLNF